MLTQVATRRACMSGALQGIPSSIPVVKDGRWLAVLLVILALLIAFAGHGRAQGTVIPMDCAQVQSLVAQYGRVRAMAWAVEQITIGTYSWREFRAAKRCLDLPKGK